MANIFKTTLKKDVIAGIANNNVREIRFPITKFWATRLTDEYNLDEKEFVFKTFDSLELTSPSNKDTDAMTYVFDFEKTYVDSGEFVVTFKMPNDLEDNVEKCPTEDVRIIEIDDNTNITTDLYETYICDDGNSDDEETYITDEDVFEIIKQWFEDENILESFYEDENVFATNARQIIVLPKGKILGSKKSLPVNNDVEVRVEFDIDKKIYFDLIPDIDVFEEEVFRTLNEIRKNNFVFVWKRYTGIFVDSDNRVYFGIRYSTRKSIGFNRKYNIQ